MPNADTSLRDVLEQYRQRAAVEIAGEIVRHPAAKRNGSDMFPATGVDYDTQPTPEQVEKALKSPAVRAVGSFVGIAYKQKGESGADTALECAVEFFAASGMIYRLRIADIERENRGKQKVTVDTVPASFPSSINLWTAPRLEWAKSPISQYAMEGVDRDALISVAAKFYHSGIRCPWFEKMLVESLIGAETYVTNKLAKSSPELLVTGMGFTLRVITAWAYSKSGGDEPKYSLLLAAASLGVLAAQAAALFGAAWYAYDRYENTHDLWSGLLLTVVAVIGVSVVLRWVVQRIVKWASPPVAPAVAIMRNSPFGRALAALNDLYKAATVRPMSVSLVREVAGRTYERGGLIDQVVVPFLDRALAEREFMWGGD